jgi:hypothetical protein
MTKSHMHDKDDKVFDVSKPHKITPDATSKPVIVGHHPEIPDPMVREHAPKKPHLELDNQPPDKVVQPALENSPPAAGTVVPMADKPQVIPLGTGLPPSEPHAKSSGHPSQPLDWPPSHELPIPAPPGAHGVHAPRRKLPFIVAAVILLLAAAYLLIDSGTIAGNVNLPIHIFSQEDENNGQIVSPVPASQQPSAGSTAAALTRYTVSGTSISFSYPSVWGSAILTTDPGFSKRGGGNQSDGTYAYLINFSDNAAVQAAITSSQYLPASRTALYYDFLQWCVGTADAKFYRQTLKFNSADEVDTPATIVCDQGPLNDAKKSDDSTIVQPKTTDAAGVPQGDIYTKNLKDSKLPVLRIKDANSANAENIIKLLTGAQG